VEKIFIYFSLRLVYIGQVFYAKTVCKNSVDSTSLLALSTLVMRHKIWLFQYCVLLPKVAKVSRLVLSPMVLWGVFSKKHHQCKYKIGKGLFCKTDGDSTYLHSFSTLGDATQNRICPRWPRVVASLYSHHQFHRAFCKYNFFCKTALKTTNNCTCLTTFITLGSVTLNMIASNLCPITQGGQANRQILLPWI